jgi:L-methionine (R)-S-oxide reductase
MVHHAEYSNFSSQSRKETLELLIDSYKALSQDQPNWVCNLSNASSLLWHAYHSLSVNVNWAGFYVLDPRDPTQLILGPFQGKVACQTIKLGKGVCGVTASSKETHVVPDVEKFPGHIACDGETKSEIVVPILVRDKVLGVIDIDCLDYEGFGQVDKELLETLAKTIAENNEW